LWKTLLSLLNKRILDVLPPWQVNWQKPESVLEGFEGLELLGSGDQPDKDFDAAENVGSRKTRQVLFAINCQ